MLVLLPNADCFPDCFLMLTVMLPDADCDADTTTKQHLQHSAIHRMSLWRAAPQVAKRSHSRRTGCPRRAKAPGERTHTRHSNGRHHYMVSSTSRYKHLQSKGRDGKHCTIRSKRRQHSITWLEELMASRTCQKGRALMMTKQSRARAA